MGWGSKFAEMAGQIEHPHSAPICAIKVEGEHKQWHLPTALSPERVPAVPSLFAKYSKVRKCVSFTYILVAF